MKKIDDRELFFGLSVFSKSKLSLLNDLSLRLSHSSKLSYIFTPNAEQVVQAQEDQAFQTILNQADYLIPDGIGLVAAARLLAWRRGSTPLIERITGVDLIKDLITLSAASAQQAKKPGDQAGFLPTVLLIGGRDYTPEEIANFGRQNACRFSWIPGYNKIQQATASEEQALINKIKQLRPDIIFVAFGAPDQESWAIKHQSLLQASQVKIVMVVGGSFDYLLGHLMRAPRWCQTLGLEWFFRLVQQPWRWKRQLRLIKFVGLTLSELMASR